MEWEAIMIDRTQRARARRRARWLPPPPPRPRWEKGIEPESEATEAEPDVIAENERRAAEQERRI